MKRLSRTVTTLEHMERYRDTGQYYNWYDHRTGEKLTDWPPDARPELPPDPVLRGQRLARSGPEIVARTRSGAVPARRALYDAMDFGFYYGPDENRVLFHFRPDDPAASPCCYDTVVSESASSTTSGSVAGSCPEGVLRTLAHVPGHVRLVLAGDPADRQVSPLLRRRRIRGRLRLQRHPARASWGGSMFEALMPALFVPEETWAPHSWGPNHPRTVQAQIFHGMTEAGYGYWGFSPANKPEGDDGAWGVDGAGMDPNGMPSNEDNTLVDHGFPGCPDRAAKPDPPPSAYTNGVVTPHAAFLGSASRRRDGRERAPPGAGLSRHLRQVGLPRQRQRPDEARFDAYLSLDQGMIMAALGNALGDDVLREGSRTAGWSGPSAR